MEKSRRKLVSGRFGNSATEGARIFQPGVRPRGLSNNRFQSRSRMGRSASGEVASKGQTKSRVDGGRNQKVYKRYSTKKNYDSTPNPFEPLPSSRASQSPRSRPASPKTGGKVAAAGTALAVGAGIGAALGGGERKKTTSAIPAKNRAMKSASSKADTNVSKKRGMASSKKEKYPNTSVSKKQEKASSLKPKTPDTSVSKKRATSRTPDSERAVKTVKTKGGDYKVYKKDSAAAKSFRKAYADAVKERKRLGLKAGKHIFTWNGKKYAA